MRNTENTYMEEDPVIKKAVAQKSEVELAVNEQTEAEGIKKVKTNKKKKKEGVFFEMDKEPRKTFQTFLRNKSKLQINSLKHNNYISNNNFL